MKSVWSIIITLAVILLMGFAVLTSANNGSAIGNIVKDSPAVKYIENTVNNTFRGLPPLITMK